MSGLGFAVAGYIGRRVQGFFLLPSKDKTRIAGLQFRVSGLAGIGHPASNGFGALSAHTGGRACNWEVPVLIDNR